jgi:hypothetical protein
MSAQILAVEEGDPPAIAAGLPVVLVSSPLLGRRLVSIPFAPVADPLCDRPGHARALVEGLQRLRAETRARRMEIRACRSPSALADSGLPSHSGYVHHFIDLEKGLDAVFRSFSRTAIQQPLRKTMRSGLEVVEGTEVGDLRVFHRLFSDTRRRLQLPPIPFRLFDSLWRHLRPDDARLLFARRDGVAAGGLITLRHPSSCSAEFVGDARRPGEAGVNGLLYWRAIEWAHAQGCRTFSFGRTALTSGELIQYKRRWGTLEEALTSFTAGVAERTVPREKSLGYRITRLVARHLPARALDWVGDILYRHIG